MRIDKNMQNASLIVWDACPMARHPIIEMMINQLEMVQNTFIGATKGVGCQIMS
jgi:hypothetical protein